MKTLIENATVVMPNETAEVSVLIDGSEIADIDPAKQVSADKVVKAKGLHLIPGVIDDQVHFRDPGFTHKEDLMTGSRACARGGVTTFLDMPNTNPATTTQKLLEEKLALAGGKSLVNYGFYIGATKDNLDELSSANRTPGIKIFMGSSTGDLLVDDQDCLERIFSETSLPICAHCEDETLMRENQTSVGRIRDVTYHSRIRDNQVAVTATRRAINLALQYDHRFHVLHVSTAEEAELLTDYRHVLTSEVCPHHLLFNVDDYMELGTLVQVNPSIKSKEDCNTLWQALLDDHIQSVASDHAPHTWQEKCQKYPDSPSGVPSVENILALMLDQVNQGRCTIEQVVKWMCENPARIWDIVDKGRIEVGYDADLVLVDMQRKNTVHSAKQLTKSRWSPWHGRELQGWPVRTWVVGHEVYHRGEFDESRRGIEVLYDHARGGFWATEEG